MLNSPDGEAKIAEHKGIYITFLHAARLKTWLSITTVAEWPLNHLTILVLSKELSRHMNK